MVAEAAQARLESAQAQWHDARVSVAAEAANLYFSQRACERQAAIAQQDAGSRTETSRLTNLSAQAGFTAPANASLARASAAEANSRATQQRALCMRDIKALVALTAWPETELRQKLAAAPDDLGRAATLSIGAVPAQALDQRPDLFSAQRDIAVASAEVGSADAQRYPRLGLNGLIGIQHYRASAARDDGLTWSIGPLALSLPLFDAGRRVATVEAAQARYDEAAFVYRARVRQAVREVEDALVNLESTAARSDDARLAEQGYRAYLEATEARYRSGLAGQMELEEFRRNALIAATALVSLQRDRSG